MGRKTERFSASQFTPTEFSTAENKAKFANHFMGFVESGFAESKFPKWFYAKLSTTFGHIAHYDRGGFFAKFFTTTAGRVRFLSISLEHPCHGDPKFTYSDVERAIAEAVRVGKHMEKHEMRLAQETEAAERADLARLLAKHEPKGFLNADKARKAGTPA